jgi:hypothetical protein
MGDEKKSGRYEWQEPKDINTKSDDFRAGYRQGYIDGMNTAADKILGMLVSIDKDKKD